MTFRPQLCIRIDEETELRILEERHAREVAELVDQNRTSLRKWLPWVDDSRSVEDSRAFIRSSLQQFAQNEGFQMGIWYRDYLRVALVTRGLIGLIAKLRLDTG